MQRTPEKETQKRAVIYTRISRDKSGEGLGVDRQEKACRQLAKSRGWRVIRVFTENDTSALKKRPEYQDMLQFAKNGGCEVIVGWAVDRITRTPREIEDLIELSEATGVVIATASGDLDLSTDAGRLVGRILASVARGEVERKGARQRDSTADSAAKGEPPKHRRAYGYDIHGSIIEAEAQVVREMFRRFEAGVTLRALEKDFAERGIVNSRGKPWTRTGIRVLLMNPRMIAERWVGERLLDGRWVQRFAAKGNWEPIIEEREQYDAVQLKLRNPKRRTAPSTGRRWLGASLYICGVCGQRMRTNYAQNSRRPDGTTRDRRTYVCASNSGHLLRYAAPIDEYVMAEFCAHLARIDLPAMIAGDESAGKVKALRGQEVVLRDRMAGLPTALAQGLPAHIVHQAFKEIEAELVDVQGKLAAYGQGTALGPLADADDPVAWWLEQDVATQQKIMRLLCTVRILPGARGRAPFDPATVEFDFKDQLADPA